MEGTKNLGVPTKDYSGIEGWLLLFIIGQFGYLAWLTYSWYAAAQNLPSYVPFIATNPNLAAPVYIAASSNVILFLGTAIGLCMTLLLDARARRYWLVYLPS